ncbi:hypothetical protein CR513_34291, partial [Mucuna pruriens]
MNKTPTRVSLLSLLINFEGHCNLLLKVLNEAHVAQDITIEMFGGIVNNITISSHLSFSEDECGNYMITKVLINNEFSLNVMPKTTLEKLYSTGSQLRANSIVVRAFDRSKREVMGEIMLPICKGPVTFDTTFQVMDIQPAYSYFLGRPWIHAVRAVPSSLHQRIKFIVGQQLINVMGEKELMISTPTPAEYIERDEEALETSF